MKLILRGDTIPTKDALFAAIAEQLPVPAYFGKNLDAFYDVLTCDLIPKEDIAVEISDAAKLRAHLGRYADALIGLLRDIADDDERLTLVVTE